jgi:hypothetical protein
MQKTFKFQVEESFQDDMTVSLRYNTLFLSGPKDTFTQFLHPCSESDRPSVPLLLQHCLSVCLYGPDCSTLCWDLRCQVSLKGAVNITVYQNTAQVGSALQVPLLLAVFAKQPLTTVAISCTLQFSKCSTCLRDRSLRAVLADCSRGRCEVRRAVFLRIGVFWNLTLCLWRCRYSLSIETSGTTHQTIRHIAEDLNSIVAHCCAPCSWYRPPAASGDTVVGLDWCLVGVGVRNMKMVIVCGNNLMLGK